MKRGINRVCIMGNLGRDPDGKAMPNGKAITTVSLATSESWKDKETGEEVKKTEWHRVVMFGKLAEIAAQWLKTGDKIHVEGKLQTRKWQAEDGTDRYTTEIVAHEMQMIGGNNDSSKGQGSQAAQYKATGQATPPVTPTEQFDDDIPF